MNNSLRGALVTLKSTDGRTHSVIVVCNQMSEEQALVYAEKQALDQIASVADIVGLGWEVADSHLVDQVLISLNDCAS